MRHAYQNKCLREGQKQDRKLLLWCFMDLKKT